VELGIYTFAERTPDPDTGALVSAERRLADLLDEAALAERVGLDVYGVGEHHRPDYVASAPAVVLAAAAARTQRIRLTSAVTVLGSADPVRVFQEFATLDLISGGRAEIMAGRGSFVESFPLFGHDLGDYDALFAEKLDLLLRLRDAERVTWSGRFRAPLVDQPVYPAAGAGPAPRVGRRRLGRRRAWPAPARSASRWPSPSSVGRRRVSSRSSSSTARRRGGRGTIRPGCR
jgi:alkanesulfonate monooxygenase SsuD/methylene tetrahydromethanopterin reductase-like flavin-dependent oxidoreductase (luciferase family)